jgi:hypothetical protein
VLRDARAIGWRVYYDDGGIISSTDALGDQWAGEWAGCRGDGVICVLVFHVQKRHNGEHYRTVLLGESYYWWRVVNNLIVWTCGDVTDDLFPANPKPGQVKEGRSIPRTEFLGIVNRAHGDRRWP